MGTLQHLQAYGLLAEAQGNQLQVYPATRLTDELRVYIRENKQRILAELTSQEPIVIEPAAKNAKNIYFETSDGQIAGPVVPEFLARAGEHFWVVTTFEAQPRWIRADRLRSKQSYLSQVRVKEIDLIRTHQ